MKVKKTMEQILQEVREREKTEKEITFKSTQVKLEASECKRLCTASGLKYKEGYEDRVVAFRMTDETPDRHNEVVIAKGVDFKEYKENPLVLWLHNSVFQTINLKKLPIGRTIKIWHNKEEKAVDGWVLFLDDEVDRTGLSEDVYRMVQAGAITKGSIGFSAKNDDIRSASEEELTTYGLSKYGVIFDKIKLLEFSIVPIPANPNAGVIKKVAYREHTVDHLKENGAEFPEEEVEIVKEETLKEKQDTLIDLNVNDKGEVTVNGKTLPELMQEAFNEKLTEFKEEILKEQKVDAILTRKNKEVIEKAVTCIKDLQSTLEEILDNAKIEEPSSPSPTDDPEDTSSEQGKSTEASRILTLLGDGKTRLSNLNKQ